MTSIDTDQERAADVFVVFGITGDLARVMTFRSLYRLEARGLLTCPIVGVAGDDWDVKRLIERARESIEGTGEQLDEAVFQRFAARLSYVSGDFTDSDTYYRVATAIKISTVRAVPAINVGCRWPGHSVIARPKTQAAPNSCAQAAITRSARVTPPRWMATVPARINTGRTKSNPRGCVASGTSQARASATAVFRITNTLRIHQGHWRCTSRPGRDDIALYRYGAEGFRGRPS